MGYRARLGKIAKKERDKYKGKTYLEVYDMLPEDAPYRPLEHTQLYELGKYVEYGEGLEPFYDFDVYEECEAEFHIMTKEKLRDIIKDYHYKNHKYFKDLYEGDDLEQIKNYLRTKLREWGDSSSRQPYWLDQKNTDGEIASSWLYEYAIFNLVYIYRTFDWKNDYLIYSAW